MHFFHKRVFQLFALLSKILVSAHHIYGRGTTSISPLNHQTHNTLNADSLTPPPVFRGSVLVPWSLPLWRRASLGCCHGFSQARRQSPPPEGGSAQPSGIYLPLLYDFSRRREWRGLSVTPFPLPPFPYKPVSQPIVFFQHHIRTPTDAFVSASSMARWGVPTPNPSLTPALTLITQRYAQQWTTPLKIIAPLIFPLAMALLARRIFPHKAPFYEQPIASMGR